MMKPDQEPSGDPVSQIPSDLQMGRLLTGAKGEFHVWHEVDDEFGGFVFETPFDHRADIESMQKILAQAGWQFEQAEGGELHKLAPDPERLVRAANSHGIPIQLDDDANGTDDEISEQRYSEIIDSGRHPVGVSNIHNFTHDVGTDHFPALIVLGNKVFDYVRRLGNDKSSGRRYDDFTSVLSSSLLYLARGDTQSFTNSISQFYPEFAEELLQDATAGLARLEIQTDYT